jgi:hypothetical protein
MSESKEKMGFEALSEEQKAVTIPYYLHEGEMTRMERLNKRWFISFLIALVMLFASNAGWIIYESQFETYSYEQEAHSDQSYAVALLNTGEGSLMYNGNGGEAAGYGASAEDQHQQSDEAVPNL